MSRFSSVEKTLPVKLTDDELLRTGLELADKHEELGVLEENRKAATKGFKEDERDVKTHIKELTKKLRTKSEERKVLCDIEANLDKFEVITRRQDTGEIIDVRPMDPEERQLHLNLNDGGFHDGGTEQPGPAEQGRADAGGADGGVPGPESGRKRKQSSEHGEDADRGERSDAGTGVELAD